MSELEFPSKSRCAKNCSIRLLELRINHLYLVSPQWEYICVHSLYDRIVEEFLSTSKTAEKDDSLRRAERDEVSE